MNTIRLPFLRLLRFRLPLPTALAMLLLTAVTAASAAPAAAARSRRPDLPELQLPGPVRGAAALQLLGGRLAAVAAHHRMSTEKLAEILQRDHSAWLDRRGKLFYVEEFPAAAADSGSATPAAAAAADLGQTFLLHSRPGAARTIYLDFNGHSASNTAWSSGTITAVPYDTDGNPGSFSDAEKLAIQEVWQRVAEDYAPFEVDVTTEEPALDRLRRSGSSDSQYGTRVVITRNTFYNCSCGGVAYVGTFDYYASGNPDYYQPAWVFYNASGAGAKSVAEAAAHEAGHNLGLAHDGTATVGYYAGHGSGATSWAPIMGVGYSREVTQWSRGEYPNANNSEDDLAIIPANGAPVRADDAGDTLATALALAGGNGTVNQSGLIQSSSDVDMYSFVTSGGALSLAVTPASPGADLDVVATLYNANGAQVANSAPADTLSASLNTTLSAGTYYLAIGGGGKGDLATGYSDYGSLGQYRVSGSYASGGAQAPKAVAKAAPTSGSAPLSVSFTGSGSSDPDGSIVTYRCDFGDGTSAATADPSHSYSAPGSYTARLMVTDSQGLAGSASVGVTVAAAAPTLQVSNIAIGVSKVLGRYQCTAKVGIANASGAAVAKAKVSGAWSGVSSSSVSATSGSDGVATLKSAWTSKRGTCTFTVKGVTLGGASYAPAQNVETFDSLTY